LSTAFVLAGGGSRRMGADKALLEIGGVRLLDRTVATLTPITVEVIVASGDGTRLPGAGWRQVADEVAGGGPLAGIAAGLAAASTELVAVVAVDMPHADAQVLTALARRWAGEAAVVPRVAGRLQPLHAIWAGAALPEVRELLTTGERSVVRAAERLDAASVAAAALPGDPRFATNVNTPEDLLRLR
jgi:molybdenum cofactor guanylyltransferase